MDYTIFDVETTTSNKGNVFDLTNSLVVSGIRCSNNGPVHIDYYPDRDRERLSALDAILGQDTNTVVGFNLKFDLNWWRRIGGNYPSRIWDCQLAEFILSNQTHKYPSLDEALLKYGYPPKIDVVKNEYWDKGIDTNEIPRSILTKYLEGDLIKTEQVFKQQYHIFHTEQYKHLYPLFKLQCLDLLVLADMEYNGVFFNTEKALKHANEIQQRQDEILRTIDQYLGAIPYSLTSDSHISSILFGGVIIEEFRVPIGVYKSGKKVGEVRYKVMHKVYELPQLIKPIGKGKLNESKKEQELISKGILTEPRTQWEVNEEAFRRLKPKGKGKEILEAIMEFNKLDKLRSTYLEGWSALIEKMHWQPNMLHSQLNQTLAITGRLSSSNPNGQNADKVTKKYCESRYA